MADEQQGQGGTPAGEKKENAVVKYFKDFGVLRETRKEYWGLQIVNMLDCLAYFAMANIVVVTLSRDFGFTDSQAGYIFTIFSGLTTIFLFISGVITDWLGVKRALYLAILGLLTMRIVTVFSYYVEEPERLEVTTPLSVLDDGGGVPIASGEPDLRITARDGRSFAVSLDGAETIGDALAAINNAPGNDGAVEAGIAPGWVTLQITDSTDGTGELAVEPTEANPSAATKLGLQTDGKDSTRSIGKRIISNVNGLRVTELDGGKGFPGDASLTITDRAGRSVTVEGLDQAEYVSDVLVMINEAAEAAGVRVLATVNNLGNGVKIADNTTIGPLPVDRIQENAGLGGATSLTITDRTGASVTIEGLDEAETVQDLVDRLNASLKEAGVGVEVTFKTAGDGLMLEDTTESEQRNFVVSGPAAAPLEIEGDVAGEIIRGGNILPDWERSELVVEGEAAELLGIAGSVERDEIQSGNIDANTYRNLLVIIALALMAPFMAMIQTAFQAGNRRFTTTRSRGAGFNLWYLFMNVGAAGGGFLIDIIYLQMDLPHVHVFTFGIFTGVACLLAAALTVRRTEQLRSPEEAAEVGEKDEDAVDAETGEAVDGVREVSPTLGEAEAPEQQKRGPLGIVKAVLTEPVFWRFLVLVTLLLGVRAVFLYIALLHPKFWYRVIGPEAKVGLLQAFNPVLVIIGLILFIPLLHRFNVYKMLVFGAMITSISMFIIAIPPMGNVDVATWTYGTTIAFLLILTVGELIWSPRLQEYTAAIAPLGQEGTYLGLSMVPYFLAKLVVSGLSGKMLERWCPRPPEDQPLQLQDKIAAGEVPFVESPYMMFTILGAVALIGTVVAILGKPWFTKGAHFK